MNDTCAHPDCQAEFGFFVRRYTCYRCGVEVCSKHIKKLENREAQRRFFRHDGWRDDGDGLCHDCESQREVDIRGWCEGAGEEGTFVHAFADEIGTALEQYLRVAARLTGGGGDLVIFVPLEPSRTHFVFAWQVGTTMRLSEFQDLKGLLEAQRKHAISGCNSQGAVCVSEDLSGTLAWARSLWKPEDIAQRVGFILRRAGQTPRADNGVRDLALAEEVALCAPLFQNASWRAAQGLLVASGAGLGTAVAKALGAQKNAAVAGAAFAGGIAGFMLGFALDEDGPPYRYRKALRDARELSYERRSEAVDEAIDAFFTSRPDEAEAELSQEILESWRSAALVGRWLCKDKQGALIDAAKCSAANPWAVAFAAAVGQRERLSAALAQADDGSLTLFPWRPVFEGILDVLTEKDHWTHQSLGDLVLNARCKGGAAKEVWQLADQPANVACVARPGREAILEGEVELLQAVGRQFGVEGRQLGLPEVLACGLAMVEGRQTLAYITRRGRPFIDEQDRRLRNIVDVVRMVRRLARTLSALHGAGYVHGDLKPENLLWDSNDALVLCDFDSVARLTSDGFAEPLRPTSPYAAPEQSSGRVCARSDIYALGRLAERFLSRVTEHSFRRDIAPGPRRFIRILDRCTSKDPDRRPTAQDLENELREWLEQPQAAMTRSSVVEGEAGHKLLKVRTTWRRQPSEEVERALLAAIESRFLVLHKNDSDAVTVRAVARNLVDAAQKVMIRGLILPWADAVRQGGAERLGRLTVLLRGEKRRARKSAVAKTLGAVVAALEGERELDLPLTRLSFLLTGKEYAILQQEWRAWLSQIGSSSDLKRMADRCRALGRLRNDLHHDASQQQKRVYGRVIGKALELGVEDLLRVEDHVLALAGWVYGGD